jgi:hypothetical protein
VSICWPIFFDSIVKAELLLSAYIVAVNFWFKVMKTAYIKFETPGNDRTQHKDGPIKIALLDLFESIIKRIVPAANPDFENKIKDVMVWLVECDTETGIPQREIGLNKKGQVILKMPYNNNYGYWTDNNLLLDDFGRHFSVTEISEASFQDRWESFTIVGEMG